MLINQSRNIPGTQSFAPKRSFRAVDSPRWYIGSNSVLRTKQLKTSSVSQSHTTSQKAELRVRILAFCSIHHSVWPFLNNRLQLPGWTCCSGYSIFIDLSNALSCSQVSHRAVHTLFSLLSFEDAEELLLKPTIAQSLHHWQDVAVKVTELTSQWLNLKAWSTGELTLENLSHPVSSHTEPFAKSLNIKYFTSWIDKVPFLPFLPSTPNPISDCSLLDGRKLRGWRSGHFMC